MRCHRCGTENRPGKIVCAKCGGRLRAGRQVAAPPIAQETEEGLAVRVRYDLGRMVIAFAAALVVGAVLGLFVIR